MQILVDIPENYYDRLVNDFDNVTKEASMGVKSILFSITNGKPLPKGHGDLIDVKDLEWEFDKKNELDGFVKNIIAQTPRIISADKEE